MLCLGEQASFSSSLLSVHRYSAWHQSAPLSQGLSTSIGSIHCTTRPIRRPFPRQSSSFLSRPSVRRRIPGRIDDSPHQPLLGLRALALGGFLSSLVKLCSPHNLPLRANTPRLGHEVDRSLPQRAALAMANRTRAGEILSGGLCRNARSPRPISWVPQLMGTLHQRLPI